MSASRPQPWTRTLGWLIRRELWEHPALWVAPAAMAGFAVLLHLISALTISDAARLKALADPKQQTLFFAVYVAASVAVLVVGLLVGLLYCLEALQGERRDRTLLFWKSLPVSDRLTVAAKFAVPTVLVPLISFGVIVAANLTMLGVQSLAWTARGFDARQLWAHLDLPFLWMALAWALPFIMLWYAPIWAWALVVSAWARRMVFLWVLAPLLGVLLIEHTALSGTSLHWGTERWIAGGILHPFALPAAPMHGHGHGHGLPPPVVWISGPSDLDTARLYTLPQLWIGVLVAALLLVLAVRLRRSRVPL